MHEPDLIGADLVTRLLSLPLTAMQTVAVIPPEPIDHMPPRTLEVPAARLLIAATPHSAPLFADTLEDVSRVHASDILLVRCGYHPETFDAVTIDVALRYGHEALVLRDLFFFRHADRGLWLVPGEREPFIELTPKGLRLEMLPPFLDADDRTDGLCRAAAEIVRLVRNRRPNPWSE